MQNQLEKLLGPDGHLARMWDNYESRPGQLTMALEVARAFRDNDFSVVEAGTGTGKTLAYLLPALLSGKKTIVSTAFKNLQDQIHDKDIPFIRKIFGDNFRSARLKGRENYLCLHYLNKALAQSKLFPGEDEKLLHEIARLAPNSPHGDRSEFPVADDWPLWREVSAPAERCLGSRCPTHSDCFLLRARKQAAAADLVLVNHHLFMADLSLRGDGFGEVLPEWEAAVFDEAHLVPEAATSYFGRSVNSWALSILWRDLDKASFNLNLTSSARIQPLATIFGRQAEALSSSFYRDNQETELWQEGDPQNGPLRDFLINFHHDTLALAELIKAPARDDEDLAAVFPRLLEAASTMLFLAEASDHQYVYQAERNGRRLTLSALPIKVSRQLSEKLLSVGKPLVFTSATLSSAGDFSYFKDQVGLWPEVEGLSIASPFNYPDRTLAYIPAALPAPTEPDFINAVAREIEGLLNLTRGRALVLFTSHRSLNHTAQWLREKSYWPILVQGEKSRASILEDFKKDIPSVLLATHSFWQGVDVPGESLSAVIVEKLPFPRPNRPLVKARTKLMEEEGKNYFFDYYIPEAALALKQGLGRLMRTCKDQGLLAVLDSRLIKKSYGKRLKRVLEPSPITSDLMVVEEFCRKI